MCIHGQTFAPHVLGLFLDGDCSHHEKNTQWLDAGWVCSSQCDIHGILAQQMTVVSILA